MLEQKNKYLEKRSNSYFYFRRRVPLYAQKHLSLPKELKLSLKTSEYSAAAAKAASLTQETDLLFNFSHNRNGIMIKNVSRLITKNADGSISFDYGGDVKKELEALAEAKKQGILPSEHTRAPYKEPSLKFSELAKQALDDKKTRDAISRGKTEESYLADVKLFINFFSDMEISDINAETATTWLKHLKKLPKNISKDKRFKNEQPISIVTDLSSHAPQPSDLISTTTINNKTKNINSILNWGVQSRLLEHNYFANLKLSAKTKANKSRVAFTRKQIGAIFSTDIHTKLTYRNAYYYWTPLIALFTGARTNEIAQLYLSDIIEIEGIWGINIKDGEDKKVKNFSSVRSIPIHKKLIELGLLKYRYTLLELGYKRLFPELSLTRDGYGTSVSKWFNDRHRPKTLPETTGQPQGSRPSFHSFRHTFCTELDHVKGTLSDTLISDLVGHTRGKNQTQSTYIKENFKGMAQLIDRLDYESELSYVIDFKLTTRPPSPSKPDGKVR